MRGHRSSSSIAVHLMPMLMAVMAACTSGEPGSTSGAAGDTTVASAATIAAPAARPGRASAGDTVLVVVNHVRAARREAFERFIEEFWTAGSQLTPRDSLRRETFTQTRVLHPVGPDADGSYAYVFIMDPMVGGASYDIPLYLRHMFPAAKADSMQRTMTEALARPQSAYLVVEARGRP